MRRIRFVVAALVLFAPAFSSAQGWIEYKSRADFFGVSFPGEPKVEEFTYVSEVQARLPARRYTAQEGPRRYSITVVDYTNVERIHAERVKSCPPDVHSGCGGGQNLGLGGWIVDLWGARDYAAGKYIVSDSKVTFYGWNMVNLVEGLQLQLTNPDESRTFAAIYVHEDRLYILEGTVPKGHPAPGLFQQSMEFLDKEGRVVSYQSMYTNNAPPPPSRR